MTGLFSFVSRGGLRSGRFLVGPLAALLLLSGCDSYTSLREGASQSLGTGRTFNIYGLEGRWAGDVTPVRADCGNAATGSMMVSAHGFAFDPFGGTFIITGAVSDSGAFQGSLKRVVGGEGSKRVERTLSFTGNSQPEDGGGRITGELVSGRCTWQVALHRA